MGVLRHNRLKTTESIEQCIDGAMSAWEFLGITEQEYMESLVPLVCKEEEKVEEEKVDGGDTSTSGQ